MPGNRLFAVMVAVCCVVGGIFPASAPASHVQEMSSLSEQVEENIRSRVQARPFSCHKELICGVKALPAVYAQRGYRPLWGLERGNWASAQSMLVCIRDSVRQAMNPADYHLHVLDDLLTGFKQDWPILDPREVADADILLTDAFLTLAGHLRAGRVNPETLHSSWVADVHAPDFRASLKRGLAKKSLCRELYNHLPPHTGYNKLRRAWESYAQIARFGGWPRVPAGEKLEPGDEDERVLALGLHLAVTGDLPLDRRTVVNRSFTSGLEEAVRKFQDRHGLRVDGIVGPNTLAALNVSAKDRARQLAVNLERWRWVPRHFGTPHVRVNVANFSLVMRRDDGSEIRQRVIVGKTARRTPVFSDRITYLVLNPAWNVPRSIMIKDILPKVIKDPSYLEKHSMTLLSGWGEEAREIDPQSIEWDSVLPRSFPYRLRQEPGPHNALGRIKFMFPNPFAVYVHDSPHKNLFERVTRDFSSGCIRVEHPLPLALALLEPEEDWDEKALRTALQSGRTRKIRLSRPVPVHLLYWTAWVDADREVNFREDIYHRDGKLRAALSNRIPPGIEVTDMSLSVVNN
ncbi:MAG: L,D-transpeptidase family protein [Thermodesulfobacteriota bacterium]